MVLQVKFCPMEDNKFWHELKALVAFLANGAFVAVHKQFMVPSPEFSSIFPLANHIHHWGHFLIGVVLQGVFLVLLVRIAWHVLFGKQEPEDMSEKKDPNGSQ